MNRILTLSTALVLAAAVAADLPATKFVHEDAAGKLAMIGEVAVVLTGDDHFITRVAEDVITINLLSRGIRVRYPDENDFGKPRRERGADPLEVARSVGANTLVTGTVVTEPPGEFEYRTVRIAIASLSVVDVPEDKTLLWVLYEPDDPVTATAIARAFTATMAEELK
ncbi:hypothetical protein JXB37_02540 [candidate division WOR-3 bacterium]|nr:hypothetical protein [candidate division WOR-3 bacterium]